MTAVSEVVQSEVAAVASRVWGGGRFVAARKPSDYDGDLIARIYYDYLMPDGTSGGRDAGGEGMGSRSGPGHRGRTARGKGSSGGGSGVSPRQLLEYSSYLEFYLWPFFSAESVSFEHVMSIVLMVNEKAREGVDMWGGMLKASQTGEDAAAAETKFSHFFTRVLLLPGEASMSMRERCAHVQFLTHAFASLEHAAVRKCTLRLASLPLWLALPPTRLELELSAHPQLVKPWGRVAKEHASAQAAARAQDGPIAAALAVPPPGRAGSSSSSSGGGAKRRRGDGPGGDVGAAAAAAAAAHERTGDGGERPGRPLVPALPVGNPAALAHVQRRLDASFLPALVAEFLSVLEALPPAPAAMPVGPLRFVERSLELFIDLLSQLPTRRFFRAVIEDAHLVTRAQRSALAGRSSHPPSPLTVATATLGGGGGKASPTASSSSSAAAAPPSAHTEGSLFTQLLDVLAFFAGFEIDDHTGEARSEADVAGDAYGRVQVLQRLVHRHMVAPFTPVSAGEGAAGKSAAPDAGASSSSSSADPEFVRDMRDFSLAAAGPLLASRSALQAHLDRLSDAQLTGLARRLRLLPLPEEAQPSSSNSNSSSSGGGVPSGKRPRPSDADVSTASSASSSSSAPSGSMLSLAPRVPQPAALPRSYVINVLLAAHETRVSQLTAVNRLPLFPSEALLWDFNLVPGGRYGGGGDRDGGGVLALPKLNLQFLSFYDYLLRCFTLARLESAYEIRSDLVDALRRMAPRQSLTQDAGGFACARTVFSGWSRMALPLEGAFRVTEVQPARVGEDVPARVVGEATVDVSRHAPFIRAEWDSLREHDAVFLVTVACPVPHDRDPDEWWVEETARRAAAAAAPAQQAAAADGGAIDGPEEGEDGGREAGGSRIALDAAPAPAPARGPSSSSRGAPSRPLADEDDPAFPARYGVLSVRGAEVLECRDERGGVYNDPHALPEDRSRRPAGNRRTWKLLLDPAQYHADGLAAKARGEAGPDGLYTSFNLLIRRKGEANNFKGVLATIRDVMNVAASASAGSSLGSALPPWLHDTLLGYGDPAAAHYTSLPPPPGPGEGALALSSSPWRQLGEIDFRDTFLSAAHVGSSFPGREVAFVSEETGEPLDPGSPLAAPPYRLRFAPGPAPGAPERVTVIPYSPPPAGPFPEDAPRANSIEFTPVQVEAIRAAVNPGLTLVVGPPGTGKTDTAVAAIAALVANFPGQRVLVVTHSNQALNDLFAKLVARDVPEHTMLRLGSGEKDLATAGGGALAGRDFSKWGRVAHALARRSVLLGEVQRLAASLGVPGDVGYTCETAEYFALYHVTSRIEAFRARWGVPAPPGAGGELGGGAAAGGFSAVSGAAAAGAGGGADATVTGSLEAVVGTSAAAAAARTAYRRATEGRMGGVAGGDVAASFPFAPFFSSAPGGLQALFPAGCSGWHALASSESCFAHLSSVFAELASYRAFELLRTQKARVEYMLTKQARVIAMTCTHAALIRPQLVELGFRYDSLVMEEAGQVTEVETLIPMLLQQAGGGGKRGTGELPRLKRVVLIGDHQQLPPVVQCQALQRYARLDQSLFARLVRLGVPAVQLNAQGRMRPQLARLYNWRYAGLGDLPSAAARPEFVSANAGMCREAQLIDVPDYGGAGESTPLPHFYQNLGEAEYIVAVYQYLRLAGWPSSSIAILTTYNGQAALLRDVLRRRCAPYGVFGAPARVETVDKFQGSQADIVLLSLVRTRAVGHLRDVRRLTVAMSRARLGLYVFARAALFADCLELQPSLSQLTRDRPTRLQLLVGEQWPTARPPSDGAPSGVEDAVASSGGVLTPVTVEGVDHMGAIVARILGAQMAAAGAVGQAPPPQLASAPATAGAGGGPKGRGGRPKLGEGEDQDQEEGAPARDLDAGDEDDGDDAAAEEDGE